MIKPTIALRDKMLMEVKHPGWLEQRIPHHIKILTRVLEGKIPEPLIGWMVVTSCRHMLRCVYGTDAQAAIALRKALFNEMEVLLQIINERGAKRAKSVTRRGESA